MHLSEISRLHNLSKLEVCRKIIESNCIVFEKISKNCSVHIDTILVKGLVQELSGEEVTVYSHPTVENRPQVEFQNLLINYDEYVEVFKKLVFLNECQSVLHGGKIYQLKPQEYECLQKMYKLTKSGIKYFTQRDILGDDSDHTSFVRIFRKTNRNKRIQKNELYGLLIKRKAKNTYYLDI